MWNAKAEEAFKEIELSQWETTASRREEVQTPLVKYSTRSSALYGSDQKYRGLGGRKACIILMVIIAILASLALVIGLAVGLPKKHEHEHLMSASSCRIPFPDGPC